jgi:hypothetical protein
MKETSFRMKQALSGIGKEPSTAIAGYGMDGFISFVTLVAIQDLVEK